MKSQTTKKLSAFIALVIPFAFTLVFNNSCQKEISREAIKSNVGLKPNIAVSSSIIYTDINPDTLLYKSGSVYNLDINNDGIADYAISNNCISVELTCLGNNEVLVDGSLHTLSAVASGVTLGSNTKVWKDTSALIIYYTWRKGGCGPGGNHALPSTCIDYTNHGPFPNQSAAFLGLRVHKGSKTYYAWATVTARLPYVSKNLQCYAEYIQDYAYNPGVDQAILTGQTQ